MANKFQTPRGMRDLLPADERYVQFVIDTARTVFEAAGFGRISTPVLEDANLFIQGVGVGTDIVDEEMYSFKDKSGHKLALRPEGTAAVMRAYIEHGMSSLPQPVKLYYVEPMFRYDRPQAGRYRQHLQFGAEVIGDAGPVADAQLIALLNRIYRQLGLSEYRIEINSLGTPAERAKYIKLLGDYYKHVGKLCDNCAKRLKVNPLRLLDCKEDKCGVKYRENAPHIVDHLEKESRRHFEEVLEYLDEFGVAYDVNPFLVRGLSYYTRTVFEVIPEGALGQQNSLGGGGRYDGLVQELGGRPAPAIGFGSGIERVAEYLKTLGTPLPIDSAEVYVVQLGEAAKKIALKLQSLLLDEGIAAAGASEHDSIKNQLGRANSMGARYALIIGQKEVFDKSVIIRDMGSGAQEAHNFERVVKELKKLLGKAAV